jgi:membrane-associated phospholipid phosphatase
VFIGGRRAHHGGVTKSASRVVRPPYLLVLALVGAAIAGLSTLAVRDGTVGPVEQAVFELINHLPDYLQWPMWIFQLLGLIGTPLAVAVVALVFRRWRLALAAALAIPLKLYVEQPLLKSLVDRERPGTTEPDPILRDVPATGESFPSGHAAVAFTLATILTPYLNTRWRIVIWALAVMNSVARIYLGAHNPLDVIGGAGAGLVMGGLLTYLIGVQVRDKPKTDAPDAAPARADQ